MIRALLLLLLATAAEAQERWVAPRLWLRAFAPDAASVIVEPQTGYWPAGVWLRIGLDGGVAELPPPPGCLWTAMAHAPGDGALAAAAFCPDPACRDARALLQIDGALAWSERGRHLANLVWRADGGEVAGLLSAFGGGRAQGLGSLRAGPSCARTPIGVAEFGPAPAAAEVVSRLPAMLPAATSGMRLIGHDGQDWLAEVGFVRQDGFVSHPAVAAALEAYCAATRPPEFGRPCAAPVGAALVRVRGDDAEIVALGGGPLTARTLTGPGFHLSETCEIERLARFRIRSRCDLLRWDPPFDAPRRLTTGGVVFGGLALSGDGRMIAALNPFDGPESSLTLIDAATGAARDHPIGDWIRAAFAATGRTVRRGGEE